MEENILVSVLMPCYNHGKYVAESVESILNQTYENIELLIVENGSTDNSREVLQQFKDNPKVKLFYLEKNDCEKAHYILSSNASGEYFAQATSDDIWMPDKLEKQMKYLKGHPEVSVCTTWAIYCDENMVPTKSKMDDVFAVQFENSESLFRHMWLTGNCICAPSGVATREAYNLALYEKCIAYWQLNDYEGWIILLLSGYKMHIYPEVLVKMREHSNAISFSGGAASRSIQERISINVAALEAMSPEMYRKVFSDQLVYDAAESEEEILCEKILFLFRCAEFNSKSYNMLAPDFFYRNYPVAKEIFETIYGLDRNYFNKKLEEIGYFAICSDFYKQGYEAALERNGEQ